MTSETRHQFCIDIAPRTPATPHHLPDTVTACHTHRLFFLQGPLSHSDAERLAHHLLTDPVTETSTITEGTPPPAPPTTTPTPDHTIDVTLLPGVTDPAAENLLRAAHTLGIAGLERAATGQRHRLWGSLQENNLHHLATTIFANPVIQRYTIDQPIAPPFLPVQQTDTTVETIPLRDADDSALLTISKERRLALDLTEMQAIRSYYQHAQRDPTDAELETLAQTWSEHCVHKTFRAQITFTNNETGAPPETIDNLLRTYLRGATDHLARPWIRSAFVDNAGIIAFNEQWDLAFKVETHNHPSALEPFGGANTGVGGVVRDILGVSARPIANTDALCFGPPDLPPADVPQGVLHPRRIADGVIHGIEDYGNKMGIPTVNGATFYHPGYTANPLVYCGCLGLLPHNSHPTAPQTGDYIIVIGGRTGRDGLRGATFSSMEIDQTTSAIAGSAVQIGHPIHEKQVMEALLQARDERLYHAITDCGAGGLASAVGEMGQHLGAHVRLESVPLKYPGLRPWEIWLSEAQERMVLAVPPEHWPRLQAICDGQDIEAVHIGEFTSTGQLHLVYQDKTVGDLDMDFLHNGIPQRQLHATWNPPVPPTTTSDAPPPAPADTLLTLLSHPNIRSKEPIIRRYDHEVQGGTMVKPLVGIANHGHGDATILVPFDSAAYPSTTAPTAPDTTDTPTHCALSPTPYQGVALSVGLCPTYGTLDPYAMAWAAIDEAMRNIVCVGANPEQVAILDNFCWGNPTLPDRLGSLVRCVQGCHDAAIAYNTPFISGKDSLNNEYTGPDGAKHAIPGTLLISAVGIVPDTHRTTTMDLKQDGNLLYLIGETRAELGGSHYHTIAPTAAPASIAPQPIANPLQRLQAIHRAITNGLVQACHDCSEGGVAVAIAEMTIAGHLGAEVYLANLPGATDIPDNDVLLFSESAGRFIIEIQPQDAESIEALFADIPHAQIGRVGSSTDTPDNPTLHIYNQDDSTALHLSITELERAWTTTQPQAIETICPMIPERQWFPTTYFPATVTTAPRVLILHATGTNRDRDAAQACTLVGADPDIVHINQLLAGERHLSDYQMLIIPGGFSYGDDLGAGMLWALDLYHHLHETLDNFITSGHPVLGICNGFQALVKAGILPGPIPTTPRAVTLAPNECGHFECRWVYLQPQPTSPCLFTRDLPDLIYCPVAHGEGRLMTSDSATLETLQRNGQIPLMYVDAQGQPAHYPANPNGSTANIAALCNPAGNVLGMMPHPENHILPWHHPRWRRGEAGMIGLTLFENGVKAC